MSQILSADALRRLVDAWIHQGRRVIAPQRTASGTVLYAVCKGTGSLLDATERPANSIKEAVFPRHEPLYRYRFQGKQIELVDVEPPAVEQIVLGARPCDATALPILDYVFNWDFRDRSYNRRRELTTVVSLACARSDEHCFCTSVGLGPDDPRGSDAMLYDLGDGDYEVRCFTDKGRALLEEHTQASDKTGRACEPPARMDLGGVDAFLRGDFERPEWALWAARCLGCGACATTCPTCHCFDIVDEGAASGGSRVRNWDACQHGLFTLHASGHNPRSVQGQRQRQRIYHKFRIYPEKFGHALCTGCGNCTRNCPVGLGVRPVLKEILRMTKVESQVTKE